MKCIKDGSDMIFIITGFNYINIQIKSYCEWAHIQGKKPCHFHSWFFFLIVIGSEGVGVGWVQGCSQRKPSAPIVADSFLEESGPLLKKGLLFGTVPSTTDVYHAAKATGLT